MSVIIKVENLGKTYLVGHNATQGERYTALRDVIARNAKSLARKTRDMVRGRQIVQGDEVEEFWALRDLSFEVKQGDRVGIIGRNGAGKSTLLKILSRITEPSTGRVAIKGRVASLLEVGTGFHPELTGRENIFLNGAILGMSRREIRSKFDEIVNFAEVEKFLDTPVKRYSSGMYVRLAFAVAAHLEPEILVVDEVLAVGDAQFQKKCLGKMEQVANAGRTVMFVSHNLGSVQALCNRVIHIAFGQLQEDGLPGPVIKNYLAGLTAGQSADSFMMDYPDRKSKGRVWFTYGHLLDHDGHKTNCVIAGETLKIVLRYDMAEKPNDLYIHFTIINSRGIAVANISTGLTGFSLRQLNQKEALICELPCLPLAIDDYRISMGIIEGGKTEDLIHGAIQFSVVDSIFFGSSRVPDKNNSTVYLQHYWQFEKSI